MRYSKGNEQNYQNACVAFGYFNGMHLGHRAVLRAAAAQAKKEGLTSILLSFDKEATAPAGTLLTTEAEKRLILEDALDAMISWPWSKDMEPLRFAKEVLVGQLGAKVVVVGQNCAWLEDLRSAAPSLGFRLVECETICHQGAAITTERVQAALAAWDIELVTALLGHPYPIWGRVEHGKQLGRTVGMPTANIGYPPCKCLPPEGVFGTRAVVDGAVLRGVTNIGRRPTVDDLAAVTVETYLLDYSGDLYGKELLLQVDFFIRGIRKLQSLEQVKAQVNRDILFARQYPARP